MFQINIDSEYSFPMISGFLEIVNNGIKFLTEVNFFTTYFFLNSVQFTAALILPGSIKLDFLKKVQGKYQEFPLLLHEY